MARVKKSTIRRIILDDKPKHIAPPQEIYAFIRKKGFLQPTPYSYKTPDLEFIKNYKKWE